MKYKRVLLKLSGESLMGKQKYGIDYSRVEEYANEIKGIVSVGVQLGIVIGGGNIFRGLKGSHSGVDRVQGDYMGMLATLINAMGLQTALENSGVKTKLLSGITVPGICDTMNRKKALENLEKGKVIIIAGGTGNPFFTTDTAAVLRALEIKAEIILKGTRVDGIYTADPEKNPKAKKYDTLTYSEAIKQNLEVMDITAFALCKENSLPILVFDMNRKGNLKKVVSGSKIGTLVGS